MSGRIKDEDVAYIRDRAPIDEVVADYVQVKREVKLSRILEIYPTELKKVS